MLKDLRRQGGMLTWTKSLVSGRWNRRLKNLSWPLSFWLGLNVTITFCGTNFLLRRRPKIESATNLWSFQQAACGWTKMFVRGTGFSVPVSSSLNASWRASTTIIQPLTIFAVHDVTLCEHFEISTIVKTQCLCVAITRHFGKMVSVRDGTKILTTNLRAWTNKNVRNHDDWARDDGLLYPRLCRK